MTDFGLQLLIDTNSGLSLKTKPPSQTPGWIYLRTHIPVENENDTISTRSVSTDNETCKNKFVHFCIAAEKLT